MVGRRGSSTQRRASFATLVVILFAGFIPAKATDSICEAVAVRSTMKEGHLSAIKRGSVVDAITQYNISKKTGEASFCSHGGGCYPADALRLTNCVIDKRRPEEFGDEISYSLELLRSKVPAQVRRQHDVELRLLDLGMCNACADNAAAFYVKMPASRCADLVRRGLEGDPKAIDQLKDTPDYCTE